MASRTPQQGGYEKLDDKTLHSATVIDDEGHEVPITEEMIQKACDELAKGAERFYHEHSKEDSADK